MAKDEVELGNGDVGDDFEVVPIGPIRKLERRIDDMEEQTRKGGTDDALIRDVLDIMKSNQKIVNDMTESTHELKNSVEDLTHKMDDVITNMNSFMDLLQEASETDLEGEVIQDVHSRIADAVGDRMQGVADDMRDSNQEVINHLDQLNKSVRRSYASENKENVLSGGRNRSERQPQAGSQPRNQGNSGGRMNIQRSQNNQENSQQSQNRQKSSSQDSERMNKLRKRFDKMDNE